MRHILSLGTHPQGMVTFLSISLSVGGESSDWKAQRSLTEVIDHSTATEWEERPQLHRRIFLTTDESPCAAGCKIKCHLSSARTPPSLLMF